MNQTSQYLVILGKYDYKLVVLLRTAPISPCFHPKHSPAISKAQLVFSDETQVCQERGLPSRTGYCTRFSRDHHSNLCLDINVDQSLIYNNVKKLTFEYGEEVRFCLGVAAIEHESGVTKGV